MNWEQYIEKLFGLAEPYLKARDDFLHTRVAHEYALLLLEKEGGDKMIVEPAVILHDIGWSQLEPEEIKVAYGVRASGEKAAKLNRIHEVEGAKIARGILEKNEYDPALIEKIARIIERHDSGTNPESLEEKLVKDADKLWRYTKIGFSHEMKRQQKVTHAVRCAFLKQHLRNWFFTATAESLAENELHQRISEMS